VATGLDITGGTASVPPVNSGPEIDAVKEGEENLLDRLVEELQENE
jgi:hypothetical protein